MKNRGGNFITGITESLVEDVNLKLSPSKNNKKKIDKQKKPTASESDNVTKTVTVAPTKKSKTSNQEQTRIEFELDDPIDEDWEIEDNNDRENEIKSLKGDFSSLDKEKFFGIQSEDLKKYFR